LNEKPIILIVEDDVVLRLSTAENLRDIGFTVVEAVDSEEAIAVLLSQLVDVVFTDINMPGIMDGVGLANWIGGNLPGLPVLLTSGGARDPMRRIRRADRRFLAKPYSLADVQALINVLLSEFGEDPSSPRHS
jgi:CheY-like chemotaxis protein